MKRTLISVDPAQFPAQFRSLLAGAPVYDSSCSAQAKVYFIDKEDGWFLKTAPLGSLQTEAAVTGFFCEKGLTTRQIHYSQEEADWLLTRRIPGEDCTHEAYLSDPKRLAETTGQLLRQLHDVDPTGCPINRTERYQKIANTPFSQQIYEEDLFPDNWGYRTPEDAFAVMREFAPNLKSDVLLHGDYCLPNILLEDWKFTGFIDLDSGGIGDRHVDLFWGAWTLQFNLKTDAFCNRFLDAYGRDGFDGEMLRAIAAFEVFG